MPDRELHEKLTEMGFTLIRESPHLIYRHRNGKQFTTGSTPGDFRHRQNALSDAAIVAGLSNQGREADRRAEETATKLGPSRGRPSRFRAGDPDALQTRARPGHRHASRRGRRRVRAP